MSILIRSHIYDTKFSIAVCVMLLLLLLLLLICPAIVVSDFVVMRLDDSVSSKMFKTCKGDILMHFEKEKKARNGKQ